MKIPNKLKIGGFIYDIVESQDVANASGVFGQFQSQKQKIFIEPSETQQKKEQTLLHEILHALCWQDGLYLRFENKEVIKEEDVVHTLSMGIYQVLNDNDLLK